jgi:hypothetical protein
VKTLLGSSRCAAKITAVFPPGTHICFAFGSMRDFVFASTSASGIFASTESASALRASNHHVSHSAAFAAREEASSEAPAEGSGGDGPDASFSVGTLHETVDLLSPRGRARDPGPPLEARLRARATSEGAAWTDARHADARHADAMTEWCDSRVLL